MNVAHLARYLRDPAVPRWKKGLGLVAALYVVLPIDVIPDVVPVLGWLDDIGVLGAVVAYLVHEVSRHARASEQVVDSVVVAPRSPQ